MNTTTHTEQSGPDNGSPGALLVAIMVVGAAAFVVLYSYTTMFLLPEPLQASRLSLGIFSRIDFFGWCLLAVSLLAFTSSRLYLALLYVTIGCGILYFSYFGAIDLAYTMGSDMLVQGVVAETGCFPSEWIPVAENHGFTAPEHDQICEGQK